MPVLTEHYVMLQRNLIYTAVTRGRKLVILVGSRKALAIGVKNNKTLKRHTLLEKTTQGTTLCRCPLIILIIRIDYLLFFLNLRLIYTPQPPPDGAHAGGLKPPEPVGIPAGRKLPAEMSLSVFLLLHFGHSGTWLSEELKNSSSN